MKYAVSLVCLVLAGALIAFWPADGTAGTVGKINGVVRDATGGPLPGANVIIQGTQRGATTDAEGYYLILSVEPGSYEMVASMVGYTKETKQDVVVRADLTTTVDFDLKETTLEVGELVVIAERPPVEPDRTMSRYVIDVVDIERVPLARTTDDLIELQPGVSVDGALRIRGSDNAGRGSQNETFVQIDGVRLVNNDGFGERNFLGVNKSALQEVQVVVGGMDAEYGNAQAGVVSLVTRENRSRYGGWGEYRMTLPGKKHWGKNVYESSIHEGRNAWGDPDFVNETDPVTGQKIHERTDYTGIYGHYFEGSVSGPFSENIGFFLSASHSRSAPTFPTPENRQPFNIQPSANLTYRPGSNVKVKLGAVYSYKEGFNSGAGRVEDAGGTISGVPAGGMVSLAENGKNLFLPLDFSAGGKLNRSENIFYGVLTHTLSPKTFYDLRISYQRSTIDTSGVPTATEDIRRDSKGYYLPRAIRSFKYSRRGRWLLKGDIISQVTKGHLAKAGFEVTRYSVYSHVENFSDTRTRQIEMVAKGDPIVGMEPFHPTMYGLYLQDKMEFEGLTVNAGVRFDALDPGESFGRAGEIVLWNHYNSLTRWRNVPLVDSPVQKAYSYRLGIGHPITDRSTIRFFTGTFYQFVDMQMLYHRIFRSTKPDDDLNGNGQIDPMEIYNTLIYPLAGQFGFVHMKPERTTSFEVGADWNFAGDYIASLTAYYKDQEGKLRSGGQGQYMDEPVFGYNGAYSQVKKNSGTQTSRGFEISLKKMFSQYTTFNLAYNIQWVKYQSHAGVREWEWFIVPDGSYVRGGKFFVGVDVRDDGQEVPRPPTQAEIELYAPAADAIVQKWLDKVGQPKGAGFITPPYKLEPGLYAFADSHYSIPSTRSGIDRRNYGSVQFLFSTPSDFSIRPLAALRMTMVYQIQTGTPYNYTPPTGPRERRNSPVSTVTDVNVERDFRFGNNGVATAFMEIRNLWGQKDDLTNGFNWVQYGLQMPKPRDSKFEKYGDIKELGRYNGGLGDPRRIVLGARVKF